MFAKKAPSRRYLWAIGSFVRRPELWLGRKYVGPSFSSGEECVMAGRTSIGLRLAVGLRLLIVPLVGLMAPVAVTAQQRGLPAEVTFAKDIAPILQRSCQNCHRADGVAPMSLVTYEEA